MSRAPTAAEWATGLFLAALAVALYAVAPGMDQHAMEWMR